TFTDSVVDSFRVEVDPGTGSFVPVKSPLFSSAVPGGSNSFEWTKTFTDSGTYQVIFRVHDHFNNIVDTYQDATLVVNVFPPQQFVRLDDTDTQIISNSGQAVIAGVGGEALDGSAVHLDATLGSTAGASVFAASYTT